MLKKFYDKIKDESNDIDPEKQKKIIKLFLTLMSLKPHYLKPHYLPQMFIVRKHCLKTQKITNLKCKYYLTN